MAKLRISSQPKEGDVKKIEGETPKEGKKQREFSVDSPGIR